jgi:hypothetical protein
LAAIKGLHLAIFLVLQTEILYLVASGLRGRTGRGPAVAALMTGAETLIYVGNGYRCPLTDVAEDLGPAHGQVTDIFLPGWLANNIDKIYGPLFGLGLVLQARILVRQLHGGAAGLPTGSPPPKE